MGWPVVDCDHSGGIILGAVIGYRSPCRCKRCYEELDADTFLDADTHRALLSWANRHRRLLRLALDDDSVGAAARTALDHYASSISVGARDLVARISSHRLCWYWLRGAVTPASPTCPWCGGALQADQVGPSDVWRCDACRIVTPPAISIELRDGPARVR